LTDFLTKRKTNLVLSAYTSNGEKNPFPRICKIIINKSILARFGIE
jgi:hypothetical protein